MKTTFTLFTIAIWMTLPSLLLAQETNTPKPEKGGKKIEELRNQFYKEKLQLSEEQEKRFKPMMHEHQSKIKEYRKNLKSNKEASRNIQNEQDLKNHILKQQKLKSSIIEEETNFELKCISIIGVQKTAQMIGLDEEFKKEMKKRIQERKKS